MHNAIPQPLFQMDAVYRTTNTIRGKETKTKTDATIFGGEFVVYKGTTGLKDSDPTKGFQFYQVTQGRFIEVDLDAVTYMFDMEP